MENEETGVLVLYDEFVRRTNSSQISITDVGKMELDDD
jgi:hypothetical protein